MQRVKKYDKIEKTVEGGCLISETVSAKYALATAMRELLCVMPFSKISVSALCDACGINRKSFYYHFKDKYDLICWIFESEFIHTLKTHTYQSDWDLLRDMCDYLDQNRGFYAKILRVEGQNSFREYFGKTVVDCVKLYYRDRAENEEDLEFLSHFLAGALFTTLFEWITASDPTPPREFTEKLRRCIDMLHNVD